MFCSRSISVHLLRGAGAVGLVVLAFGYGSAYPWLMPPLVVGAVVLLRGCPMCWLAGLFETMSTRRSGDVK